MPPTSIYRSPAGECELHQLYDIALQRLDLPAECRKIATRYGHTNVLVTGPVDAPPLLVIHGAYDSAPSNLRYLRPVARQFRTYALDTVGQSVRSAQTQLSLRDNSHGEWVTDVMDGLGLAQVAITSSSFGAGIALRALAHAPTRFTRAALVVPSGIANGSLLRMTGEIFLPWIRYFRSPTRANLLRAAAPIMTEPDEDFLDQMDAFLRNVRWKPEGPRLATPEELRSFTAPVLIFVADNDCFFPGPRVAARARQLFPNLASVETLHGKHLPSRAAWNFINQRVISFLTP